MLGKFAFNTIARREWGLAAPPSDKSITSIVKENIIHKRKKHGPVKYGMEEEAREKHGRIKYGMEEEARKKHGRIKYGMEEEARKKHGQMKY
jgi:hypothetical protein